MENLLALPLQLFHPKRYRPGGLGTWSGHLPFANDLVTALRPELLVELGSHYGESYFGFCQAVAASGIACKCFAVDTWQGDEHAGYYDEAVFDEVAEYNRSTYRSFSTLLRTTFNEAATQFAPESIDLLHIDGQHTYNAVKHDFYTWFPKVKPGGIVLLHDIEVKHADFEVWRFWEDLAQVYPHFAFHHWWGLGVVQKPGGQEQRHPFLDLLFHSDADTASRVRRQYSEAAELLEFRKRSVGQQQSAADAGRPYLQVFAGINHSGFLEKESSVSSIEAGNWQTHTIELPHGSPTGQIRIDPVDRPAVIEISNITVYSQQGIPVIALTPEQLAALPHVDGLVSIWRDGKTYQFSGGSDPSFILQLPPGTEFESRLRVEISMRVRFTFETVSEALGQAGPATQRALDLQAALVREQNKRTRTEWDYTFAQTRIQQLDRSLTELRAEAEQLRGTLVIRDEAIEQLRAQLRDNRERLEEVLSSVSWKATAPLRTIAGPLRSRKAAQTLPQALFKCGELTAIETDLQSAIAKGALAGAVVLISRDGKIGLHRAFGWQDREEKIPMSTDTIFRVLSMTKSVTCAALMTLVDAGKICVQDPVEKYLPEFEAVRFADGRKPKQSPKIWHLMAHTAGLADSFPEGFYRTRFSLPDVVGLAARNPLGYEPGEGWAYSNGGIAAVGRIVEKLSGLTYAEYVRARIFDPLGMNSSTFRISDRDRKRLVTIYCQSHGALTRETEDPINHRSTYISPENGLHTTAVDLWRFLEMIRNGGSVSGRRVLTESSAHAMVTVQTEDRSAGFLPGMGYGYGMSLVNVPNGIFRNHSPGTFGHGAAYQTHGWVDPVKRITGIFLCQNASNTLLVTEEAARFIESLGALE